MTQLIFCHGEKGGVGKSMIATLLVDYAIRAIGTEQVFLVEGDTGIHDVAERFSGIVPGIGVPLNRPDEMASQDAVSNLFERISGQDASAVIVNLPAAAGETLDPLAETLIAPAAEQLGYEVGVAFAVGPGQESVTTAGQSQDSGLVSICQFDQRLAVLNQHLGTRFAWESSFSRHWEGYETYLPPLLERVAERVRATKGAFSAMLKDESVPVMERLILRKWLGESDRIGEFFFGKSKDDSQKVDGENDAIEA